MLSEYQEKNEIQDYSEKSLVSNEVADNFTEEPKDPNPKPRLSIVVPMQENIKSD